MQRLHCSKRTHGLRTLNRPQNTAECAPCATLRRCHMLTHWYNKPLTYWKGSKHCTTGCMQQHPCDCAGHEGITYWHLSVTYRLTARAKALDLGQDSSTKDCNMHSRSVRHRYFQLLYCHRANICCSRNLKREQITGSKLGDSRPPRFAQFHKLNTARRYCQDNSCLVRALNTMDGLGKYLQCITS